MLAAFWCNGYPARLSVSAAMRGAHVARLIAKWFRKNLSWPNPSVIPVFAKSNWEKSPDDWR
jgi:hypothetical protein